MGGGLEGGGSGDWSTTQEIKSTYRDVPTTVMTMMRGKAGTPLLSLRASKAPSMGARRQRIVVLVAVMCW